MQGLIEGFSITALLQGFALGGSLIIAIGAQNAFVIRQGVRGEYVFAVATLCFLSDAILMTLGAAGVGTLIATDPTLRSVAAWGGGLFLLIYGGQAAWSFLHPKPVDWAANNKEKPGSLFAVMGIAFALTYLNPHVYLDTVVLVGGLAAQFDSIGRVWFTLGAISASMVWFYGLAYGATRAAPFFKTTLGARLLDATICLVMWIVAATLIRSELSQ